MRFKPVKLRNFCRFHRGLKRQFFNARFTLSSGFVNCFNANTENFVNFPDIFCNLVRQKAIFSFFAHFSKTLNYKKIGIIFSKVAP